MSESEVVISFEPTVFKPIAFEPIMYKMTVDMTDHNVVKRKRIRVE